MLGGIGIAMIVGMGVMAAGTVASTYMENQAAADQQNSQNAFDAAQADADRKADQESKILEATQEQQRNAAIEKASRELHGYEQALASMPPERPGHMGPPRGGYGGPGGGFRNV